MLSLRALPLALPTIAAALAFASGPASGCGSSACVDLDGDGFFVGTACDEQPIDCDDTNVLRNRDCELVPPPDCVATPTAAGCPCASTFGGRTCFPADPAAEGVGGCRAGFAVCTDAETLGVCEGAVLPGVEACNERDDDCDGRTDEGSESPCGGCTPGCEGPVWGGTDLPFEAVPGLALTAAGELTLEREERIESTLWLANSAGGTLTRIDTELGVETARYATGPADAGVPLEPSRVAVDNLGDAWVANRSFGGISSLLRVAGERARCLDANDDGMVTTSEGPTPLPFGEDECVTLVLPVGEPGDVARALAIDGNLGLDGISGGDVWVGYHDGEAIEHRDGLTGALVERVETPGFAPYGAVFDREGTLWMISRQGQLLSLDRRARPLAPVVREAPLACFLFYGVDVDAQGGVLVTGFDCDQVHRFDPRTERWTSTSTDAPSVRGAVVDETDATVLRAWVSHTDGRAARLRLSEGRWVVEETFELLGPGFQPLQTIGAGLDARGRPWFVSEIGVLDVGAEEQGVATALDPVTGIVAAQVPVGRFPHTQGDMTGAKRAGRFEPEGLVRQVFAEGCPGEDHPETEWRRLHLDARAGAAGSIDIRLRQAADPEALEDAPFVALGTFPDEPSPYELAELDLDLGGAIEVELTLRVSAADGAPVVGRVGLEVGCPGPI